MSSRREKKPAKSALKFHRKTHVYEFQILAINYLYMTASRVIVSDNEIAELLAKFTDMVCKKIYIKSQHVQ